MSDIEWTDETWNPVVGCKEISPGCRNCYAAKLAHRGLAPQHKGLTVVRADGPHWNGEHRFVADALDKPLHWRKGRKVFPCSMSDLFRDEVTDHQIAQVFAVMALARQHTFQVLTKRPERLPRWFEWIGKEARRRHHLTPSTWLCKEAAEVLLDYQGKGIGMEPPPWPLPNVWIGTTVEDRARLPRLDYLRQVPAAVRWVSLEPLLEDLGTVDLSGIGWAVIGGESGQKARACDLGWIRSLRDQCQQQHVAAFIKQLGARPVWGDGDSPGLGGRRRITCINEPTATCGKPNLCAICGRCEDGIHLHDRKGGSMEEWPTDLQVREFPEDRP